MLTTTAPTEHDKRCLDLVNFMLKSEAQRDGDGVPLKAVAQSFSTPILALAASQGLIELGQHDHNWSGPTPGMVVTQRDPDTNAVIEEHHEDKRKLHVGTAMRFVLITRHGSKTMKAIIKEDHELADPIKYHIRLTNDGVAAAA